MIFYFFLDSGLCRAFLSFLCKKKGGRVNLFWRRGGQERKLTRVPWGMPAHNSVGAWRSQRLQLQWGQLWQGHSCQGGTCEQVVGSGLLFQSQMLWAQALESWVNETCYSQLVCKNWGRWAIVFVHIGWKGVSYLAVVCVGGVLVVVMGGVVGVLTVHCHCYFRYCGWCHFCCCSHHRRHCGRRLLMSRRMRQDGSGPHSSGCSGSGVLGWRRRATNWFQWSLLEALWIQLRSDPKQLMLTVVTSWNSRQRFSCESNHAVTQSDQCWPYWHIVIADLIINITY